MRNAVHGVVVVLVTVLVSSGYAERSTPLCQYEVFDAQVRHLLDKEMLNAEEIDKISPRVKDLQDVMRTRWEDAELIVFGSVYIGLGTKASDVDVHIQVANYDSSRDAYFIEETAKILHEHPEKYDNIEMKLKARVPIITFYDIALQRDIDLSFPSDGFKKSKLTAYYLNLDKRLIPLAAIVKLWAKVHELTGKWLIKNYGLYLMIVFYLQQKNMALSGFQLQKHAAPCIVDEWNVNYEEIPYSIENSESLYELLGGFFNYYSEFNFSEYCVSTFAGRPLAKRDFEDITRIPKEFSILMNKFKVGENDTAGLQTDMCIQEMSEHNRNNVKHVDSQHVLKFIHHVKHAADKYNELPCDEFLQSILTHQYLLLKNKNHETAFVEMKVLHIDL